MAMSSQVTSILAGFLVALVLWVCPGQAMESVLCSGTSVSSHYCHQNQSRLCNVGNGTTSCTHQLRQTELEVSVLSAAQCQIGKFVEDCGSLWPSRVYAHEKPLVEMRLYLYSTWMGQRPTVNITFPSPDWNDLKFQYKTIGQKPICRQFRLHGVSLPLNDTLVYDCVVFSIAGDVPWDAEFTVENDRGEGRTFIYRVPNQSRIHPWNTQLPDWHVFFYLHQDFIASSSHLPVTIQSAAPFRSVSYKVSIVKCLATRGPDCGHYSVLNSTLVVKPKEDEWTVLLPIWSNPGSYAVTVQIVSDQCPSETGCYVSMSPRFEIKPSMLGAWITIGMVFFLISFLTFLLMFNQRLHTNRNILLALREVQPTVLLVYLPESQHHLEFINMFAEFLKSPCHLLPYLVDQDVGNQDPNCWTRDHISRANKVLFMVPSDSDGESITPIRNQWIVALNYLAGHHFTTHQVTRKVAAVILPSSGNIPSEISHARYFKLVDEIAPLVTWLHNGTWLDEVFLWRPQIRSRNGKTSHTWSEIRNVAFRNSSPTEMVPENHESYSLKHGNIFFSNNKEETTSLRDKSSIHSENSTATDDDSHLSVSVFDPDIPSIDRLDMTGQGSKLSISNQSSYDTTDSDDDDDIFT